MYLSNEERETIIIFSEADSVAKCETCNQRLKNRLDKVCADDPRCSRRVKDEYATVYTFPRKWLRVQKPRDYTDEELAKMRRDARERFGKRKDVEQNG